MTKELILSNLRLLRSAVEAQPEKLFDLSNYKQESKCGTLFCTAGLAATMPEFQEQGMGFRPLPAAPWKCIVTIGDEDIDDWGVAAPLFGDKAWDACFAGRADGLFDDEYPGDLYGGSFVTDKQLALWRLDAQIEAVEAQ